MHGFWAEATRLSPSSPRSIRRGDSRVSPCQRHAPRNNTSESFFFSITLNPPLFQPSLIRLGQTAKVDGFGCLVSWPTARISVSGPSLLPLLPFPPPHLNKRDILSPEPSTLNPRAQTQNHTPETCETLSPTCLGESVKVGGRHGTEWAAGTVQGYLAHKKHPPCRTLQ